MVYAQILNGIIKNTIVLKKVSLEDTFAQGFDVFIRIDTIEPRPGIGWSYENDEFSPPPPEEIIEE